MANPIQPTTSSAQHCPLWLDVLPEHLVENSNKEWHEWTYSQNRLTNPETKLQFSSVQVLSCVWLFVTPWIAAHQASLSITNSRSSLRVVSIKSVMPSSHLILCRPLLLLPLIPRSIRVLSNESTLCMRWPKYWSFSFSIFVFYMCESILYIELFVLFFRFHI